MVQRAADQPVPFSDVVHSEIAARLTQQQYATWFQRVVFTRVALARVMVNAPNRFLLTFLQHRYLPVILEALDAAGVPEQPQVEFQLLQEPAAVETGNGAIVPPAATGAVTGLERSPDGRSSPLRTSANALVPKATSTPSTDGLPLNPDYTFNQFVIGPTNRLAHAASTAVSDSPGLAYNPLFLYGSVGLGKTHLLQAVAHDYRRRGMHDVRYLSCEAFTNDFIAAVSRNGLDQFRAKYREADALLIDDVQLLAKRERTQEEFFHTFNAIYNQQKQIILTSDSLPSEIAGLGERLVSRFKLGLVAELTPPSYETRVAIILRKAENLHLAMPREVADYVATQAQANVRELEGALLRLHSVVMIERRALTVNSAEEALAEFFGRGGTRLDLRTIQEKVLQEFKIPSSDLHSRSRTRSVVMPRQVCMYLARKYTRLSLGEIGIYFGGRDHSTVLHAVEKIERMLKADSRVRTHVGSIERRLGGG